MPNFSKWNYFGARGIPSFCSGSPAGILFSYVLGHLTGKFPAESELHLASARNFILQMPWCTFGALEG